MLNTVLISGNINTGGGAISNMQRPRRQWKLTYKHICPSFQQIQVHSFKLLHTPSYADWQSLYIVQRGQKYYQTARAAGVIAPRQPHRNTSVIFPFWNIFWSFSLRFLELHSHNVASFTLAFRNTRRSSNVWVLFLFLAVRSPQTLEIRCVSWWCRRWHQMQQQRPHTNQPVEKQSYFRVLNILQLKRFHFVLSFSVSISRPVCLGGRVVRTLDLRSTGREFESWPPRCRVQPWASC